ncbi:MAG: endolytic transglycosylase MltG [Lachnospiraceae bacterium]|nr:endolytic transglycosylase MltG [Ruminococcus sp.]MCM1274009.1 endolytic transglycosylase MltG [Lachnospiraceae bacterium]
MDEKRFENNEEFEEEHYDDMTREMDSIQLPKISDGENHGITPREEFIELNSADDMSKTLLMDSMSGGLPEDDYPPAENPVHKRKRKHKKKQINHTRTMGQIFLGVLLSVGALALGVMASVKVIGAMRDITGLSKPNRQTEFEINSSMGVNEIIDNLHAAGVIDMPSLMKTYMKLTDQESGFLDGIYTLSSNMSYNDLLSTLKTAKTYTKTVDVAIPEGLTAAEIGRLLEENLVCRAVDFEACYKAKLNKYDFEEGIAADPNRLNMLEGYIFPDTYQFYVIDDMKKYPNFNTEKYAQSAADKMFEHFETQITRSMRARMEELGLTLDETIRLASLIQWEGNSAESMAMVSSVFHNRLNDPETYPQLQSDTTYTYIDEVIKPKITSSNSAKMQAVIDAYDTYKCEGLPAGAICNPGLDAINAALYPADTEYYYFVASKAGDFYYARTAEGHDENVEYVRQLDMEENGE